MTDKKALGILALLMMVCFLPLVDKAFHIDEPMYLWAARQILKNPLDFYGFTVNWDGVAQPMADLMQNPPLSAYYLALLALLFGWNESLLHIGFLPLGFLVVWGTYRLARDMSCDPHLSLVAALAVFCTPAFFVLANYVTCDMAMVATWIWAVIFWRRAVRNHDRRLYAVSGLLMAAASLTKYVGAALIPLLLVYALAERRRPGLWLGALLIPVGCLIAYQLLTAQLYGHGLISGAAAYAAGLRVGSGAVVKGFTGLVFVGGSLVSVLFLVPIVAGKKGILGSLLASSLFLAGLLLISGPWSAVYSQAPAGHLVQAAVMAAAGVVVVTFAMVDAWQKRDADSLLIFCWIAGILLFTCYVNWTISVRNILPMAPAAALVMARRIRCRQAASGNTVPISWIVTSLAALAVSGSVAWADYRHAGTARTAAHAIGRDLAESERNVWFQGHWGFQYYMEGLGMNAFDVQTSPVNAGDVMVVPGNNSNTGAMDSSRVDLLRNYSFDTACCIATMNTVSGAGFYTDDWGGLPYAIGPTAMETYQLFLLR